MVEWRRAGRDRRREQVGEPLQILRRTSPGAAVLVDAAGVAANFQRMVRIADSMGIPIDDMTTELGQQVRQELDLARFETAQNSAVNK